MIAPPETPCTAFAGTRLVAAGPLVDVALAVKRTLEADPAARVLIFDDASSLPIEVDLRGDAEAVRTRLAKDAAAPPAATAPRGPGRPKLGVVAREVTLLPRHWDWLAQQPGGASAALRRLVEAARRDDGGRERARRSLESVNRFMTAMTGDLPGHEEASRAFYRGDREGFQARTADWPEDVRDHLRRLAAAAWDDQRDAQA